MYLKSKAEPVKLAYVILSRGAASMDGLCLHIHMMIFRMV